jgi:NADH-quinone oxidoreductase subunit L
LIGAGITAFYMTRVMIMTFFGKKRWEPEADPHESPQVMTIPLVVLGTLSVVGGAAILYLGSGIEEWLAPVTGEAHHELGIPVWALTLITMAVVAVGATISWLIFGRQAVPETAPKGSFVTIAARKDLYGDAFNEAVFMRPGQYAARSLVYADSKGVDGVVMGAATGMAGLSARWRRWQTGFVRSYALTMLAGAGVVVLALLLVRLP